MLLLSCPHDLANLLSVKLSFLLDVIRSADRHLRVFEIRRSSAPSKTRLVVSAQPPLYNLQRRFFQTALVPNFAPSECSHGGVRGKSIKSNAMRHAEQHFVYTTDISDFFPSIRWERVRAWFEGAGCDPSVSWMCARLCTADGCLQQGLLTSPFIADQLMKQADAQITAACERLASPLVYTRYVDDIAISGQFDLLASRLPQLVRRILKLNGFRAKVEKEQFGKLEAGTPVTKLRVRNGRVDVQAEYATELVRTLRDHASLTSGGEFLGPLYTHDQLWGKVSFVTWVNPGRTRELRTLLSEIDWQQWLEQASTRGLLTLFKN